MITLLGIIFMFGVLIFFHELGHFLLCKACKVRVTKFSIGFGPALLKKKIGETVYQLSIFPFGGFVKPAGEEYEVNKPLQPDELVGKSKFSRLLIFAAGSGMNLFLGFIIFVGLFKSGTSLPAYLFTTKIGKVIPGSPAAEAGILKGDEIVRVNKRAVSAWKDILKEVVLSGTRAIEIEIKRGKEQLVKKISLKETLKEYPQLGIYPFVPPIIGEVQKNTPAEKAGLKPGDEIVTIAGRKISAWDEMVEIIQKNPGKPLELTFRREGKERKIEIIPKKITLKPGHTIGRIGITQPLVKEKYPFGVSVKKSAQQTLSIFCEIYRALGYIITRRVSIKNLRGPIGLGGWISEAVQLGLTHFLRLLAIVSINLAAINLLPIPVLDGGHILFLGIESIRRKPLEKERKAFIQNIALILIILLITVVSYYDIIRLFQKFFKK
jgi:regulator of sigma E protease